jgi:hypothetical protein
MEAEMPLSFRVPLCLMMFCIQANAQEQSVSRAQNVDVGRGVVCDTADQIQRFVMLRDNGRDMDVALNTVNEDAQSATACNFVLVKFTTPKPLAALTVRSKLVSIVEIRVVAFGNGTSWRPVPGVAQYTVVLESGTMI